ncbi:MAG: class I SAM-dependent methyltransferase [Thaumarchaeota archaeon]|nr:class I SAM-dependent methyltransferase [Candidatus Terraquivivens yellowstonensis]
MSIVGTNSMREDKHLPQVEPEHYFRPGYLSKGRFISWWHQINEIVNSMPSSILEVGIGPGLVAYYLTKMGFKVTTMNIDERLGSDMVGSVLAIPCSDNLYDLVPAFQVLEHLPYEDFPKALCEIHRVTRRYAVLSLPDCTRAYRFEVQIPKVGDFKILLPLPRLRAPIHRFDGQHYWEIGKAGYPLRRVLEDIRRSSFRVIKCYRVFEMPYRRFFVLAKEG